MKKICICLILALLSIINASSSHSQEFQCTIYVDDIEYYLYSNGRAICMLPDRPGKDLDAINKKELVIQPVVTYEGKEYRVIGVRNLDFGRHKNNSLAYSGLAFELVKIPLGVAAVMTYDTNSTTIEMNTTDYLGYYNKLKSLYFVPKGAHRECVSRL